MSVTYRDLPQGIDPVAHLFGDERLTVPESYFTPELTVRFYERCLEQIKVESLHNKNKSKGVHYGLESLPSLLRFEPTSYNGYRSWLRREVNAEVIRRALPSRTPYQLQYLVLFGLDFPDQKDLPMVPSERFDHGLHTCDVVGGVDTCALLYGKNEQLYFITAVWKPAESYFKNGKEPRHSTDPLVFNLSYLKVEPIDWQDSRIKERIESGKWSDVKAFKVHLYLVLEASASVLENRARVLRRAANLFDLDGMSIYSGR